MLQYPTKLFLIKVVKLVIVTKQKPFTFVSIDSVFESCDSRTLPYISCSRYMASDENVITAINYEKVNITYNKNTFHISIIHYRNFFFFFF